MKKILLVTLSIILAMGALGVGYALWFEELYVDVTVNTGELDWEFWNHEVPAGYPTEPTYTYADHGFDPPAYIKDVAQTNHVWVDRDGDLDWDTLELEIIDAYPGYYNHISTHVHCNGTVPLIIVGAWVTYGDSEAWLPAGDWVTIFDGAMRVSFGNNYGDQLHFCDSRDISFDFKILQPAEQGHTYTFSIRYVAVQYNEYEGPGMYVEPSS